jgi:hypothetical protein
LLDNKYNHQTVERVQMSKYSDIFLLRDLNVDGTINKAWLFTGNLPKTINNEIEKVINSYNTSSKIPISKILKDAFGSNWQYKLGLTSISGGDIDIPDDIVGDIFEADGPASPEPDTSKPDSPKRESTKSEHKLESPKLESKSYNGYKISIIHDSIYPEDRVSEIKSKIYASTGILPMFQHLFYRFRDQVIPLSYTVSLDSPIRTDIIASYEDSSIGHILGFPVDHSIYPNKDELTVRGYDFTTSLADITSRIGSAVFDLVNLEPLIMDQLGTLKTLMQSDRIQVELLYYGFIVKFYPMITFNVLEQMINNFDELKNVYPDLVPSQVKLDHSWKAEQTILDYKYAAKDKQYTEFDKSLSVSVKSAILSVESIATDIGGRVQLDLEKLFTETHTSLDVPIIKVNLYHNRSSLVLTKIHTDPTIQKVYDSVRFRLKLQYPGTILFVLRADEGYLVLVIGSNGRYYVRLNWEDEVTVTFSQMYKIVQVHINKFIESINARGRSVFNSSNQLAGIKPSNSKFTDLHINMIWFRSLTDADFASIESSLRDDMKAGCIKPFVQLEPVPNSIGFAMYKGMSDYVGELDEFGWNTYLMYSDARIKQRWQTTVDTGRPTLIVRRATDVKFDLENLTEREFLYFYDYIKARLFKISSAFKARTKPQKLEPISEKNRLRLLKERDPQLYKFKRFGSNIVYSRICQKQHQPEVYYQSEYDILPSAKKSRAVKYWNFTQGTPMYYVCPNPTYPFLSFIVGSHPKNYCLPCCKKTVVYDADVSTAKKSNIYNACVTDHEYSAVDTSAAGSRYIMTYGKPLDIGRISYLPGLLDKYLRYNLPDDGDVDSGGVVPIHADEMHGLYSIDQLWKLSKNNKIREIPIEELKQFLNVKSWNYQLSARPGEIQYSPMEIIQNPNLSSTHFNRITNADLSFPVLLYRWIKPDGTDGTVVVDGLHRIAKLFVDEKPIVHVRYVTRRQLAKSKVDETQLNRKSLAVDNIKKAGYYVYGVPQNTTNVANIGCLFAVATSLRMTEQDFIAGVIKKLRANKGLFNQLLSGNLTRYFAGMPDLISTLERIGSKQLQLGHFEFIYWNELFMDFARYCYGKYCIIFDDKTVDISGTSLKHTYDDINLILPDTIQDSNELIPPDSEDHPTLREYVLILKKRKKSKNILTTDNYYYPIFVFVPHEFFKTLNIKKRVFIQSDIIVKSIKSLIDDALAETNRVKYDINLNTLESFCKANKLEIQKLWINVNDRAYMSTIGGVQFPIKASDWRHLTLPTTAGAAVRSVAPIKSLLDLIQVYNSWIVKISEQAGLIRVIQDESEWLVGKERTILPMYPLIKMEKIIILGKNIIGFHSNGLHYYFKPTPLTNIKEFVKRNRGMIKTPLQLESLQHDPDVINKHVWSYMISGVQSNKDDKLAKLLPSAIYNKSLYSEMIQVFMDHFDNDRNQNMRGKLKHLIISSKDISKIRSAILSWSIDQHDIDHLDLMLNSYARTGDRGQLLENINETIFRFDRINLNKLRDISENYLSVDAVGQTKIHIALVKQLTSLIRHIIIVGRPTPKDKKLTIPSDRLKVLIDIFAMDLVNPLRREYLLSGIYSAKPLLTRIIPGIDEQIYSESN